MSFVVAKHTVSVSVLQQAPSGLTHLVLTKTVSNKEKGQLKNHIKDTHKGETRIRKQ